MAPEPLQPNDIEQLSEMLQGLLKAIEDGEMTVSTATRYRLEGAVVALGAVFGDLDDLRERLLGDPD
jgi:hypothetical protein